MILGWSCPSRSQRATVPSWALSEAAARRAPLTVLSVRHDRTVTYTAGGLTQDQAAEEVQALMDQAHGSLINAGYADVKGWPGRLRHRSRIFVAGRGVQPRGVLARRRPGARGRRASGR